MIEIIVSTMLVGIVVVGAMSTLGASVRTQRAANDLITGPLLADQLLAEIMAMPYKDPEDDSSSIGLNNGEADTSRTDFDDVDDFDNWAPAQVQDRIGNVLNQYSGWTRTVDIGYSNQLTGGIWIWDTGLKRITVCAISPTGVVTKRYALRWKEGSLEQPSIVDKTVVTQLHSSLQVGTGDTARHSTSLLNHVEDPNEN